MRFTERDRFVPIFESKGIKFTEIKPVRPFMYDMFLKPVKERKTGEIHYGYGWCGGSCRWGTTFKTREIEKYKDKLGGMTECVGIAADEKRLLKPEKFYPLVEWGMTEADCLEYCYQHGAEWNEDGVRLYDVLDRVSCWCCRNKNMKELKSIHDNLPKYWGYLEGLEYRLGQMKSKPLSEIGAE